MNTSPEFSDLLSHHLAQRDRSPAWLARRLDLHPGTVSRWLNQRTRPATPELVIRVADVLGVHTPAERQALMLAAGFAYVEDGTTSATASVPHSTPAQAQQPAFRLPVAHTSFVGRERELAQIAERFDTEGARLQTILGAGGIGKTSLALQAARQNGEKFRDGVFFVSVAGLSSPDEVAVAILTTINAPERKNIPLLQQLSDNLYTQNILLILDNFEDVLAATDLGADLVTELLRAAPRVHVMVTARERLNLVDEWLVPLGPLPYPAQNQIKTDPEFSAADYAALHLFALCAQKLVPSFSLESSNLKIIAEICRLVDGFPLAIEMAAAWVRALSVAEIADELQQGLDFLVAQSRDALQRQSSMTVVMDRSWQMLSPPERNAMTKLSVFRGGFTRQAAQVVAEASLLDLTGLMDKSWLQMTPAGRYYAHRLALQYAAMKLTETNLAPATNTNTGGESVKQVLARHAHYFASLIPENWHFNATQVAIGDDIDNVRLAWQSSIDQQLWYEMNRLIPAISLFTHTGWSLTGQDQLNKAVGVLQAAQRDEETLSATDRQLVVLLEAKVRFTSGEYQNHRGNFDEALVQMQRSRQLFSDLIKDKPEVRLEAALVARELGFIYYNIGVFDEAERFYNEALQIKGDVDLEGRGIYLVLMLLYDRLGRYAEANEYAKMLFKNATANESTLAHAQRTYIRILTNQGQYAAARKMQAASVDQPDSRYRGHWLRHVGSLARSERDSASALPLLQESLTIAQIEGEQSGESDTWLELGTTHLALEQYKQAHEAFEQGLAIARQIGRGRNIPVALTGLARTALLRGHHALVHDYLRQAVDASAANIVPPDLLDTLLAIAQWHAHAGRTAQASKYLRVVASHPATVHEIRQQAEQLLRTLEHGLLLQAAPEALPDLENPELENLENLVTLLSKDLATWEVTS